jgi:hypothetical protein
VQYWSPKASPISLTIGQKRIKNSKVSIPVIKQTNYRTAGLSYNRQKCLMTLNQALGMDFLYWSMSGFVIPFLPRKWIFFSDRKIAIRTIQPFILLTKNTG